QPAGPPSPLSGVGPDERRSHPARFPVRRAHDLLRIHASRGDGQRPSRDVLPARRGASPCRARLMPTVQSEVTQLERVLVKHARAVGQGYRTNAEGIRQLRELLAACIEGLIVVPLPHWRGPNDVFHLMSMVSPIDRDLFLVYAPLLPIPFREALLARGIELIEVPEGEFATLGCNVLALAPRCCVMVAGNPETRTRLRRAGVEVREFGGREICLKGGGGPTCLTRPLVRSPVPR